MDIRKVEVAKVLGILLVIIVVIGFLSENEPVTFDYSTTEDESITLDDMTFFLVNDTKENPGDLLSCRLIESEPEDITISRREFRNNHVVIISNDEESHTSLVLMYDLDGKYKVGYELRFGIASMFYDNVFVIADNLYYFKLKSHLIYKLSDPVKRYAVPMEHMWELLNYNEPNDSTIRDGADDRRIQANDLRCYNDNLDTSSIVRH